MRVFRIAKTKYTDALDCTGAKNVGGRWNSKGVPVLYATSSQALAILEMRVHSKRPGERRIFSLEVPDDGVSDLASLGLALPTDWMARPHSISTATVGDGWVASNASLGLLVPSVVSPKDYNVVLNPAHPRFPEVKVMGDYVQVMDERLWSGP